MLHWAAQRNEASHTEWSKAWGKAPSDIGSFEEALDSSSYQQYFLHSGKPTWNLNGGPFHTGQQSTKGPISGSMLVFRTASEAVDGLWARLGLASKAQPGEDALRLTLTWARIFAEHFAECGVLFHIIHPQGPKRTMKLGPYTISF